MKWQGEIIRLTICRHGETDFNVQRRLQGWMETRINAHGKKQAKLVAQRLKAEEFDYAFCSPLMRTRQTFLELMRFHKDLPVQFRDELREIHLGIYTGMDRGEIDKKYPGHWSARVDNKYDFHHEGGESYKSVDCGRVAALLDEFREKYSSRKVLVLTHQGTAKLLIGSLLGLPPGEKMQIMMPNDCIYFVDYLPHKTVVKYELLEGAKCGTGWLRTELKSQNV